MSVSSAADRSREAGEPPVSNEPPESDGPAGSPASGAPGSSPEYVPPPPSKLIGQLLTVAGAILAVLMAVLSAFLELLLIDVRVGGVLIGVSVLLALGGNLGIGWFAYRATGHKIAVAPPAFIWLAIILIAAGGTGEGDYLIASNNWVGWAMIAAGSLSWTIVGIRLVSTPPDKRPMSL